MTRRIAQAGGEELPLSIAKSPDGWVVEREGLSTSVQVQTIGPNEAVLAISGKRLHVHYLVSGTTVRIFYDGEVYSIGIEEPGRPKGKQFEQSMMAPMPGVVLKMLVQPGDVVVKGAPLLILEAMKMEHQITAPYDGRVRTVRCSAGELVQPGVELIEIERAVEGKAQA